MKRWTPGAALVAVLLALLAAAASGPAGAQAPAPPDESRFQKVLLEETNLTEPMRIEVAPDGRVVYIQRNGQVKVWLPSTRNSVLAGIVPTQVAGETGMIGMALAPDFATTGHIYLNRALPGFNQSANPNFRQQRVSRFTLGADNVLDLASELPIIQTTNRGGGGHSGGDMKMGSDGLLLITTGDNTGCCASFGYPPHDERPGQEGNDAQRSAANTNDLNGKLLRIRPLSGGGYEIPEGNLFPEAADPGDKTRPEIYAMGFRNLFTIGDYDPATGFVWIADYGPDAALDSDDRGPRGYVREILVTRAANYGWPYCTANNIPYADWDYVANVRKGTFNCDAPVNDSPNNTGLPNLPPITPANIYWSYTAQEPWPMLYGGGAHAGATYRYDPANPSPTKFPEWFDGRRFMTEFTSNWIASTRFAADNRTPEDVRLHFTSMKFGAPFDTEFGPDGSLYVLEFGANSFSSTRVGPAIYRIDYVEGNRTPLVKATASVDSGAAPLTVQFEAAGSTDPDGDALTYSWDFTNDGTPDATGASVSHTFTAPGEAITRVTVTDSHGASAIGNLLTTVGNTRPTVELLTPLDGGFHEFTGSVPIPYKLRVTDPEDGSAVDCTRVEVTYLLGHNAHQHPVSTSTPNAACEGTATPSTDAAHGNTAYLYHTITASYRDAGAAGAPALDGQAAIVLHPRAYQAQQAQAEFGTTPARAVYNMGVSGAWLMYPHVDLAGIDRINFEISGERGETGGTYSVHVDSPTGPVVARRDNLPDTGTQFWVFGAIFQWLTEPIVDPGGVHDIYIVVDYPPGVTPGRITLRNFQFVTAPSAVTASVEPPAPNGANGWYTSNPVVTVSTGGMPLWTRQTSLNGGTTWTNTNAQGQATISTEGTNAAMFRAIDSAGVVAPGGALTLKLDRTPPAVPTVEGIADGASRGDSEVLHLALASTDATSGVDSVRATLDGEPIGSTVQLYTLPLGSHTLVATATDNAGLQSTRTLTFSTKTSFDDMRALVNRLFTNAGQKRKLLDHLDLVLKAIANGNDANAIRKLNGFKQQLTDSTWGTAAARAALVRDADAMIETLD